MNYMKNGENGHETMPGQDAPEGDGIQWTKIIEPPVSEEERREIREKAGLIELPGAKSRRAIYGKGSGSIGYKRSRMSSGQARSE